MGYAWRHDPFYFAPVAKPGGGWTAFKDAPAAPAPPNYAAAAQAQGAANIDTARAQGRMSNPNINTPYGNQSVTWGGGFDSGGYNAAQARYEAGAYNPTAMAAYNTGAGGAFDKDRFQSDLAAGNVQGVGPAPDKAAFTRGEDQATITQTLSPAQQQLLDSQNRISQNLAGVAERGINRVGQGMEDSFDTSRLPGQASSVANGAYRNFVPFVANQTEYDGGGDIARSTGFNGQIRDNFDAGSGARTTSGYNQPLQSQVANAGQQQTGFQGGGQVQTGFDPGGSQSQSLNDVGRAQRSLDFSGAPRLPGTNDFSADRDAVTNAMLSRSEPQFQRDEELTRTRLMNQGLAAGSEASNYDLDTLNRSRNDARQQAILAGGQEQSRLFGLASAARGQYTGEQTTMGNFANTGQSQAFNQGLAGGQFSNQAQQAQYGQNLGAMQAQNQAQAQAFGQNQAQAQFANTAQQNQFGQNLAAGQFANQSQQQGYGQAQGDLSAYNAAQAQNYAQNQGAAQFGNAAQAQGYTQALGNTALQNSAQAQANQQNQAAAQFSNQAEQTNYGNRQQNAALQNQVAQQQFTQGLANANLTNQARQQAIQEQAYMRQLPLNELNSLRTGAQVQNPQFQPFQGVGVGQTPVFQGAQAQGQANQNLYNAQQGASNSFNGGLMSAAGTVAGATASQWGPALAGMFAASDRRLKSNIVRLGTHPLGIGWYEYDIFGQRVQGVMAQELIHVKPSAVGRLGPWLTVDYGAL